jgi:A/G-specific adenine glycosylase
MTIFSKKILKWYEENKRSLPWRSSKDPYKIWLSEIMLQQTRVAQGTPYYLKFIAQYPTVHDLANAPEDEVLKLWQGLGYYSRARNLHETAKVIASEHHGNFPKNHRELLKLKGVGDYTASAIASICFDEPQAVVDGNVYRVLARYFGVALPINSTEGIKYFKKLALEVMDSNNIRDYNQGIMEFGALQCAPRIPNCEECPLNESCVALQKNQVDALPVKLKKTKIRKRYFNYVVPILETTNGKSKTLVRQRTEKGIWQNLWQFPLLETDKEIKLRTLKKRLPEVLKLSEVSEIHRFNEKQIVHKLSHQHLHCNFWVVFSKDEIHNSIEWNKIEDYAVPVLIAEFIETFKKSYF